MSFKDSPGLVMVSMVEIISLSVPSITGIPAKTRVSGTSGTGTVSISCSISLTSSITDTVDSGNLSSVVSIIGVISESDVNTNPDPSDW